jgi:2-methylisocitrate lyase-like PEP mutase family enzyme
VRQRDKAELLRALHSGPHVLVLPNAWDVASARAFARMPGCRAIATTSGGIAAALGYPDGERIPAREMLAAVERIADAVDLPVTADLEAGYGDAAATALAAIEVGAAGINLEDGAGPVSQHVARIRAARAAADEAAVPLVLNARVDVYLRGTHDVDDAIERSNAYLETGADCAFVIGVTDAATIARLVEGIDGPLNVLATDETPPIDELARLGVRRVSVGSGLFRAGLAAAEAGARELLERGTYSFAAHR